MCVCVCVRACAYIYVCVYMYVYVCLRVYVCVYVYIYIYITPARRWSVVPFVSRTTPSYGWCGRNDGEERGGRERE